MRSGPDWTPARGRLALAVVVGCAAALALRWAFLVPIFQSPDEQDHFDYALCINQTGGLLKAPKNEHPTVKRHPYTFLLMERAETAEVCFNPSARMPLPYGTREYFAAIDRDAPPAAACRITQSPGLAAHYPFGYYAVLAIWLQGVRLVHGDGPVGLFFGARLFSVLLLVFTLLLTYASARELGTRRTTALLLVGCIGCFPMVSFVNSYIQPDNLAFTLVSLSFYLALRLRHRPQALGLLALLGLALGLLLVTKIHFFLCVGAPVVLMLGSRWLTSRPGFRGILASLVLLGLPSLLLGLVHWRLTRGAHHYFGGTAPYTGFVAFYLGGFTKALRDFFMKNTHQSFWGVFGWMDTPLVLGSEKTTEVIGFVIQAAAWILLALTLFRLEQVTARLVRAARRGHPRRALQLAFGNVPVVSYFVFTVFMFALYIRLDNRFGAQGRNWLPFMLPIFWTALLYAPRALQLPALRRLLQASVVLGLVFYATAGSYYALETITHRYYHTPDELDRARSHPAVVRCPVPCVAAGGALGGGLDTCLVTREISVRVEPRAKIQRLGPAFNQPRVVRHLVEAQQFCFTCPFDSLRAVEVMLHTGNSHPRGTVTLSVLAEDGQRLGSSTVETDGIIDHGWQWFPLHGIGGVKGRALRLHMIYTPAPGAGGVVATFSDPQKPDCVSAQLVDG